MTTETLQEPTTLLKHVEQLRVDAGTYHDDDQKSELGQFFTPLPVATLMASMLGCKSETIRVLDAGAGVGSLFAACVSTLVQRKYRPKEIVVTAFESDVRLEPYLRETITHCQSACKSNGVRFSANLVMADFIESAADRIEGGLFQADERLSFNCAILNPPYRKINSNSNERRNLRRIGVETSNLYTGFLAATIMLLEPESELVAITPRSFCNGPYFLPFRKQLLNSMALKRIHIFDSRKDAFKDNSVLQENIIFHSVKNTRPGNIEISSSVSVDSNVTSRKVSYPELVKPGDRQYFIHIVAHEQENVAAHRISSLKCTLQDLDLNVSTGRVVDFRTKENLRAEPESGCAPLIYPCHFLDGFISWPKYGRKPNALVKSAATTELFVPNGNYVLVKRFSSKEERKRIVAAVHKKDCIDDDIVGFENHLNYFHKNGKGLPLALAKGLSCFLNTSIVDAYFRQFNGHTQVNATDLRSFKYPTWDQLTSMGNNIGNVFPDQETIDALFDKVVY